MQREDDEPQMNKLIAMTLGDEGFRVIAARPGDDALNRVSNLRPDVVTGFEQLEL